MLKPLDQKLKVAILVCPGFFPGDLLGAHSVFGISPNAEIHLVWKTREPFEGFPRWPMAATTTFNECPDVDVLVVGLVPPNVITDPEVIAFFQQKAKSSAIVIGICAGTLLLGAAGLLKGRRATTTFPILDALKDVGATPVPGGRVVVDDKFYTTGPATGSFEAALIALATLRGEDVAKCVELILEFDPHPPFKVGNPKLAGTELTKKALEAYGEIFNACQVAARTTYEASQSGGTV